jgi:hypothetical protein
MTLLAYDLGLQQRARHVLELLAIERLEYLRYTSMNIEIAGGFIIKKRALPL